jgi:hypothetical protein
MPPGSDEPRTPNEMTRKRGRVMGAVRLRHVVEADIDVFFAHQRDPEAVRMAVFTGREQDAFREHWRKIVADRDVVARTILTGDAVVGHVVVWEEEESGRLLVGYWIGRDFWGKGIATSRCRRCSNRSRGDRCTRRSHAAMPARSGCWRSAALRRSARKCLRTTRMASSSKCCSRWSSAPARAAIRRSLGQAAPRASDELNGRARSGSHASCVM